MPGTVTSGLVLGTLALCLGAADFVIKDSLKLVDDRIKQSLSEPRTAFRKVVTLDCTRRTLLRLNLVAMACKGFAGAVAAMASQDKAPPLVMAAGCGSLAFGAVLTAVIFVSHECLVTKANSYAVEEAEAAAARGAAERMGNIGVSAGAPERRVIAVEPAKKRAPKKQGR